MSSEKKIIHSDKAPKAIGPYSQATQFQNLVFLSGQVGFVPETGKLISDDIQEQTRQTLTNLKSVLEAGNSSLENVLKCTVLLDDMSNFAKMNEVYSEFFPSNPPARMAYAVKALPAGAKVEIEAIAISK
ncbi:RutC family protein [Acrasis kona]|uniref:RutC family protein n=1 Tax=Acrasis kona TaxID=1008807 RepID=A0AAW2YP76_9EUKA